MMYRSIHQFDKTTVTGWLQIARQLRTLERRDVAQVSGWLDDWEHPIERTDRDGGMEGTSSERQPCGIAGRTSFLLGVNAVVPGSEGRPAYSGTCRGERRRGVRLLRRIRNI